MGQIKVGIAPGEYRLLEDDPRRASSSAIRHIPRTRSVAVTVVFSGFGASFQVTRASSSSTRHMSCVGPSVTDPVAWSRVTARAL
ncbi:MAG: hypothetical protein L0H64_07350 [Pseudonocardia sp.]|nr:hypothetical protein [Pseudonocardia sp.]